MTWFSLPYHGYFSSVLFRLVSLFNLGYHPLTVRPSPQQPNAAPHLCGLNRSCADRAAWRSPVSHAGISGPSCPASPLMCALLTAERRPHSHQIRTHGLSWFFRPYHVLFLAHRLFSPVVKITDSPSCWSNAPTTGTSDSSSAVPDPCRMAAFFSFPLGSFRPRFPSDSSCSDTPLFRSRVIICRISSVLSKKLRASLFSVNHIMSVRAL